MNDYLTIAINVSYVLVGFWILGKIKPNFLGKKASWTYGWAGFFLASVLFSAGLLIFDIPLALFGANNHNSTNRMREIWWGIPSTFFLLVCISIALRTIYDYLCGNLRKEGARTSLFLGSVAATGSVLALVLITSLNDSGPEGPSFEIGTAVFFLIVWMTATSLLFFGAIVTKATMKK